MSDFSEGNIGGADVGQTMIDPDTGAIMVANDQGEFISTGLTDYSTLDNIISIPNANGEGQGPGGSQVASGFNLGEFFTNGVKTFNAIAAQVPATVKGIRDARTAIAAVNTPTLTEQWLRTPLQTQLIYGGVALLILLLALGKIKV
jgi:hypothetical protein